LIAISIPGDRFLTKSRFTHYWLPVVVYCAAIFIQSSLPATGHLPKWPHLDKVLHVAAYALLGFLFFRALATGRLIDIPNLALILSIIFTSLYGASDEIHQAFVPARSAEVADALADLVGGFLGAGCGWLRLKRIDKTIDLL
jgi:VanZ family protein